MFFKPEDPQMVATDNALVGRTTSIQISGVHSVNGHAMCSPFPEHLQQGIFALGCFWGAERKFWNLKGVYSTAVGYVSGFTPNPTYEEVCSGSTGHTEAVLVTYHPEQIAYPQLLKVFWESHNPTQGMRQGNDVGTQYRSGIYTTNKQQLGQATSSLNTYQLNLEKAGLGKITTEITPLSQFYFAEEYHQQYLHKNPNGYCGLNGCNVSL